MDHDFKNVRRGAILSSTGKTRITIYLDDDVLGHFRTIATDNGRGYQTEINAALRRVMRGNELAQQQEAIGIKRELVQVYEYNVVSLDARDEQFDCVEKVMKTSSGSFRAGVYRGAQSTRGFKTAYKAAFLGGEA